MRMLSFSHVKFSMASDMTALLHLFTVCLTGRASIVSTLEYVQDNPSCPPFVKSCNREPISDSDRAGLIACASDPKASGCETTKAPPYFYVCKCNSGSCRTCALPDQKCAHACAPKMLVMGGESSSIVAKSTEEFDGALWRRVKDMPGTRQRFAAASLSGLVYAVGGVGGGPDIFTATVDVYNSSNGTWSSGPNMTTERASHGVGALNGKLYAVGGFGGNRFSSGPLCTVEGFDPTANKWTPLKSMSATRWRHAVGALGGYLYAVGGEKGPGDLYNSVEKYDPNGDRWYPVKDLNFGRNYLCVAVLDEKLYAVGGSVGTDSLASAEVYDATRDEWTVIANMTTERTGCVAAGYGGLVYVAGGYIFNEEYLDSVEAYNPRTKLWTLLDEKMTTTRAYAALSMVN